MLDQVLPRHYPRILEPSDLQFPIHSGFTNTLTSKNFGTYTTTATNMRQMQGSLKFTF